MVDVQKLRILAQAVSRLSPQMAIYLARRVLRNRLVPYFSSAYHRRLARIKTQFPKLTPPKALTPGLTQMAEFYCAEYRDIIDDVVTGTIHLNGHTEDFGAPEKVDWNHKLPEEGNHQMWRVKLAHMGYLAPMLLEAKAYHHEAVAALVKSAGAGTDPAAPGAFNGFWFPYAASHRVLAIGSAFLIACHRNLLTPEIKAEIADFLRSNVAFVLDNVEHELCNNHVERNLAALCLYLSHVSSLPEGLAQRLEGDITHLINKTILADGSQIERSPMYQGLCIASLAVMAETPFLSESLRAQLTDRLSSARAAFAVLCGPDGEVALFNDAWHGEVPRWDGPPAPDGRSLLPEGGYGRLSQGSDLCLMDAGALGPRWNPGHGHADFLSLELTLSGHRLAVDPGTSRYNTGAERARERAAKTHNGPIWQGHEPVNFFGCFKVGKLAEAQLVPESQLPENTVAGIFSPSPGSMGRMLRHYPGQGYLIADLWQGVQVQGQVSWLIPAYWNPVETDSGRLELQHSAGAIAQLDPLICATKAPIAPSQWANRYGKLNQAFSYTLLPLSQNGQQRLLTWIGHDAAPHNVGEDSEILFDHLQTFTLNGH